MGVGEFRTAKAHSLFDSGAVDSVLRLMMSTIALALDSGLSQGGGSWTASRRQTIFTKATSQVRLDSKVATCPASRPGTYLQRSLMSSKLDEVWRMFRASSCLREIVAGHTPKGAATDSCRQECIFRWRHGSKPVQVASSAALSYTRSWFARALGGHTLFLGIECRRLNQQNYLGLISMSSGAARGK